MKKQIWLWLMIVPMLMLLSCNNDSDDDSASLNSKQVTFDDLVATWITTTKDGKDIPLEEAAFCELKKNDGHSVISYIENGTWVSKDVVLSIDKNYITRVINGNTEKFEVLYFDKGTIIWKNLSTGNVVTRKKIMNPEGNKEKIRGFWQDSKNNNSLIFKQDSVIRHDSNGTDSSALYKVYGDVLVIYTSNKCSLHSIAFGYDTERGVRYMNYLENRDADIITDTFYKPNYESKLAGGWLWGSENGKMASFAEFKISFFNPITHKHDYQTFSDGYKHIIEDYTVSKRQIMYPEDAIFPYETIVKLEADTLITRGHDGTLYEARRIKNQDLLKQTIIGEWNCPSFNEEKDVIKNFTHVFDENGVVMFKRNGVVSSYGSYHLYSSLLVLLFKNAEGKMQSVLWLIKDGKIENGKMTFVRRINEETNIENTLTKVVD